MKTCNRCKESKPFTEFGLNKYYLRFGAKDGLSIYCKRCNWRTTIKRRADAKAPPQEVERKPIVVAPRPKTKSELVLEAVAAGCRTRDEIAQHTKIGIDQLVNLLAELALTRSQLRIVRDGERREFHLAA